MRSTTPGVGIPTGRHTPDHPSASSALDSPLTRRSVLGGLATGAALMGSGATPAAARAKQRNRSELATLPAAPADALVDTVGVNTHFNWRYSPYGDTERVVAAIDELGIRHVRDRVTRQTATRQAFSGLARSGTRVEGVCGALGDPETMAAVMDEVVANYADPTEVFSAFEGINEPNNNGVPWVDETRAKIRDLHRERGLRGLQAVPIVGPALARVNGGGVEGDTTEGQSARLGDLTDVLDLGNIHVYPRVQTPSNDIDRFTAYQRLVCGQLPIVCTEGGYFNAMNYVGGAWPTPEDVAAKYLPKLIVEHWIRGTRRFFFYEFLDRYDPTNAERLSSFGLIGVPDQDPSASWRFKPGYVAVKNLLSIMADPGAPHSVRGIPMSVKGGTDLRSTLFAKRDGSRYLALWRDVSCYDAATRTRQEVPSETATLSFGARRVVTLFRPTVSGAPVRRFSRSTTVKLSVGDELLIAKID